MQKTESRDLYWWYKKK